MFAFCVCACAALRRRTAQTTVTGSSLAMKSTGSGSGTWTLDRNGYVGTYINVPSPGNVTVRVNANGTASGGINPHMNIVLARYEGRLRCHQRRQSVRTHVQSAGRHVLPADRVQQRSGS